MRVLGQPIDDRHDDGLATDLGESFDEVHGDVHPHRIRNRQWMKQTSRVEVLCFIVLTNRAAPDEFPHQLGVVWCVERRAEPLQHLLDALVEDAVSVLQDGRPQLGRRQHERPAVMDNDVIHDRLAFVRRAGCNLFMLGNDLL
jgi:hypothetical protein